MRRFALYYSLDSGEWKLVNDGPIDELRSKMMNDYSIFLNDGHIQHKRRASYRIVEQGRNSSGNWLDLKVLDFKKFDK
ncbi:MAG: hypothetical protein EOP06_02005 [Proteobacteria bacterium]|nr:MAG: hypothetical protein EOP06_02005 [Pseudomonadota bacterium]